ncbi:Uncharacterised protein [Mycobacteroides abscessus]|nr:Uncharacterised protein [Mycobacteroides abscessus]CQA12560.1 Uncharacterised protein [Mycobacteroides abscessus]
MITDSQKPTRQPQAMNAESESVQDKVSSTRVASRLPNGTAACGQLAQNPRCESGECSATNSTAPPHSPPTAKPCRNRRPTSSIGAA